MLQISYTSCDRMSSRTFGFLDKNSVSTLRVRFIKNTGIVGFINLIMVCCWPYILYQIIFISPPIGGYQHNQENIQIIKTIGGEKNSQCRNARHCVFTFSGVRHFMFVDLIRWSRYSCRSQMFVLMATLFSHSNSAHIWRNSESVHDAGTM